MSASGGLPGTIPFVNVYEFEHLCTLKDSHDERNKLKTYPA